MMDDSRARYLLRTLSGPHAGAEALLDEGEHVVGDDLDCDIVLSDPAIAGQRLTLTVAEGELGAAALNGSFAVDGRPADGGSVRLAMFQILTFGATQFALGPVQASWPDLSAADRAGESQTENAPVPQTESGPSAEKPLPAMTPPRPTGRSLTSGALFALACLVLAGSAAFLAASGLFSAPTEQSTVQGEAPEKRLQNALERDGFRNLTIGKEGGRLVLRGYAPAAARLAELTTLVRTVAPGTKLSVRATDSLLESSREALQAMGLTLDVSSPGDGRLLLEGYVRDKTVLERATASLEEDVPGVNAVESRIVTHEEIMPALLAAFRRLGPHDKMEFLAFPGHILARGTLTEDGAKLWSESKDALAAKYPRLDIREELAVEKQPLTAAATRPSSPFIVRSIVAGAGGFGGCVTLADGRKFFEGGRLKNGLVVKRITPGAVVLSDGKEETVYRMGGE